LIYVEPQVLINGSRQVFNSEKITENIHHAWYESAKEEQRPTEQTVEENLI